MTTGIDPEIPDDVVPSHTRIVPVTSHGQIDIGTGIRVALDPGGLRKREHRRAATARISFRIVFYLVYT